MIDLHDSHLNAFSVFYELDTTCFGPFKNAIFKKRTQFAAKQKKRDEERQKAELEAMNEKYMNLIDLLTAEDKALLNVMCVTAGIQQDNILASIIRIFEAYKKTIQVVKDCITHEIQSTKNPSTLFRGNSTATKLLMAFTKMIGKDYLTIIKPVILQILDDISIYEIDSSKVTDPELCIKNMNNLIAACQNILQIILSSIDLCPVPFRLVANHMQQESNKQFPNLQQIAVGGFLFLRFFCPAILSPDSCGLIPTTLSNETRRPLIIISKCIQNLASLQLFAPTDLLAEMNNFLKDNFDTVQKFLETVSVVPENFNYEPLCSLEEAKETELKILQEYLVKNLEKVCRSLINYKNENLIDPLCTILGELGDCGVEPETIKKVKDKPKVPRSNT